MWNFLMQNIFSNFQPFKNYFENDKIGCVIFPYENRVAELHFVWPSELPIIPPPNFTPFFVLFFGHKSSIVYRNGANDIILESYWKGAIFSSWPFFFQIHHSLRALLNTVKLVSNDMHQNFEPFPGLKYIPMGSYWMDETFSCKSFFNYSWFKNNLKIGKIQSTIGCSYTPVSCTTLW